MPNLSHIMRRAWSLLRQSMAPYSRPAFAAHLRQAWHEARNAPVTPWDVLQRHVSVARGSDRAEVIRRAEHALAAARITAARYRNAPEPRDAYAARKRSNDIQRLGALERIVAAEKAAAGIAATYTAKRDEAGFVLKRNGVQFGRLTGDRPGRSPSSPTMTPSPSRYAPPWCHGAASPRPSPRCGPLTKPFASPASPDPHDQQEDTTMTQTRILQTQGANRDALDGFIVACLAPLPDGEEPADAKAFLADMERACADVWHVGSLRVRAAQYIYLAAGTRSAIDRLMGEESDWTRAEEEVARAAHAVQLDRQMRLPAPSVGALRWKEERRKAFGGKPEWEAAIAADVERLAPALAKLAARKSRRSTNPSTDRKAA